VHFPGMGLSIEKKCALLILLCEKIKNKNGWVEQWLPPQKRG
jgi:hypothetical protein